MSGTYVKKVHTSDTGGGVMCDFIEMEDGTLLVISDDAVCLYQSMEDFYSGNHVRDEGSSDNMIYRPTE